MLFTQQKLPIFFNGIRLTQHAWDNLQLNGEKAQCTEHQRSENKWKSQLGAGPGTWPCQDVLEPDVQETPSCVSEAPSSSIMDPSAFLPHLKFDPARSFAGDIYFFFPPRSPNTWLSQFLELLSAGAWPRQVVAELTPLLLLKDREVWQFWSQTSAGGSRGQGLLPVV